VLVSGIQQNDSVIHIQLPILFQILFCLSHQGSPILQYKIRILKNDSKTMHKSPPFVTEVYIPRFQIQGRDILGPLLSPHSLFLKVFIYSAVPDFSCSTRDLVP